MGFYERARLLPNPARKDSGYRTYGERDLHRLGFIGQAKQLKFSLREIRDILEIREPGHCPCREVIAIAERHFHEAERQLLDLQEFRAELARALERWKRLRRLRLSGDGISQLVDRTMMDKQLTRP